ncbi:MAG: hypothetical protein EXR66_08145 [Dehalococcoidia bacterium]|nr:hypothetical protein [Dehalococcoidia bacterium]
MTVDCDSKGAAVAREFIEAAHPEHPSLLDPAHLVPELYNTRNVPAVFWIDESGTIVRGNDPVYASRRNRETGATTINEAYLEAVRDWVRNGTASIFLTEAAETRKRVGSSDPANEQAMAHFRLGVYLEGRGEHEAAVAQFREAHTLKPDNWNYRRQAWNLGDAERDYGAPATEQIRSGPPMYPQPLELPERPAS